MNNFMIIIHFKFKTYYLWKGVSYEVFSRHGEC